MPDERRHRGAHPEDARLFAEAWGAALRAGVTDLSWLLSRNYATPSALKIVGDRYGLNERQRTAVMRCACSDAALHDRTARRVAADAVRGRTLWIDGYNVLTTAEAALGGGVLLAARDGCYRDMASIHGTYRKVEETLPALDLAGRWAEEQGVAKCVWFLDSPVSNSGRLKGIMREVAEARGWAWDVQVVPDPDKVLSETRELVASADSVILDRCGQWVNLARGIVRRFVPSARVVEMTGEGES